MAEQETPTYLHAGDETALTLLYNLSEPFPESEHKFRTVGRYPDQKTLTYVDLMSVVDRLNQVCPQWSMDVTQPTSAIPFGENRFILIAEVALTIPGIGTRSHVGVQVVNATSGGEDLWKGAISDALKKAASLFGVARELYDEPDPTSMPDDAPSAFAQYAQPAPVSSPSGVIKQSLIERVQDTPASDGDSPSQAQINFMMNLAYERDIPHDVITSEIRAMTRQGATKAIDDLKKMPPVHRLQRGESPPAEWSGPVPY